jgi:carboxypeptidase PM20D1
VYLTRYNFSPSTLTAGDLPTIHGTNERIAVDNYLGMVRFYVRLLRNAG